MLMFNGRIQISQLVHDLSTVSEDSVQFEEAIQGFLQPIQPFIGQTCMNTEILL